MVIVEHPAEAPAPMYRLRGRDIDIVVRTTPKRKGQRAVSVSFA